MKRSTLLRQLLTRHDLDFVMEAHDGLSAKIVEEAGFAAIWGSGLTISACFGARDSNELSWSQVTDHVAFMAEAAKIPILLDGDTGYGNFNNMRRFVRKLGQIGVGGVAIEDKIFPKLNSFLRSERQPLADMNEFCGKIKAAKDNQIDDDFVVVARVEALIAGWGMAEALRRAEAYRAAGADAILIHSKHASPAEIFEFLAEWQNRAPIVLVPTKYYTTSTDDFRERKVSLVIWANHLLRAAITAMQEAAKEIHKDQSLISVEPRVASLQEVFRLQGDHELEAAEAQYLPASGRDQLSAVVLAAGGGTAFGELTSRVPKAMLHVRGQPILARLADDLASFGCRRLTVVRGYNAKMVDVGGAKYVDNEEYASTNEAFSLSLAAKALKSHTVVSFGDIVLKRYVLHSLFEEAGDGITIVVDSQLAGADEPDRVRCDRPYTGRFELDSVRLKQIGAHVVLASSDGAWIGLMHLGKNGEEWMREEIDEARTAGTLRTDRVCDLLGRIVARGREVRVVYIHGGWTNVNNTADLVEAGGL